MAELTLAGQMERAERLLQRGQLAKAALACRRVLESFPKYVKVYSLLGMLYLELGEHEEAANLFRRVLGVDPEHTLAYASLGAIYEGRGLLDEAIWQYERAFELSPGNRQVRRELVRLCMERDVTVSKRVKLNRAALARIYLRGHLYARAIGELRELLREFPQRFDLRVALAEALWRDGRYPDAEAVCQGILDELPNCLKALLILGRIWLDTEQDEQARALLQRAQELDPENVLAQELFGSRSPLPPRTVRLPLEQEELPPLGLAYLEEPGQEQTIEGKASLVSSGKDEDSLSVQREELPAFLLAERDEGQLTETSVVEEASGQAAKAQGAAVKEEPWDPQACLERARRLWNAGQLEKALPEYRTLLEQDKLLLQVLRDLELVNRVYPGNSSLQELLLLARQKQEASFPKEEN